ncbi:MAG: hypothetical protein ACFCUE_14930 [Candidatus Bathyarchaeia archaeon]
MDKTSLVTGILPIVLLILALILYLAGVTNLGGLPLFGAGDFVYAYLVAGQFSTGVFAAGTFAIGVFAAGIFAVGIFSVGIFSIGIFSFGIYAFGVYVAFRYLEQSKSGEKSVNKKG